MSTLHISSPDIKNSQSFEKVRTCDGAGSRPNFEFGGVSESAKSLALVVKDVESDTYNWVVWNIPVDTTYLGTSDSIGTQKDKYKAPCPPADGTEHHFEFTLYSLSKELEVTPSSSSASEIVGYIKKYELQKSTPMTLTYTRAA